MPFEPATLLGPLPLGILLVLILAIVSGLSVAFVYHWRKYGMNTSFIQRAPVLYFFITVLFVALSIISYLLTL